jgi:prevent-host-death family protein
MNNINIEESHPILTSLIDQVNTSHQATLITTGDHKQAVLISLEEWKALQETLYLLSISQVKEDLIAGKNTPWEDCTPLEEVEW